MVEKSKGDQKMAKKGVLLKVEVQDPASEVHVQFYNFANVYRIGQDFYIDLGLIDPSKLAILLEEAKSGEGTTEQKTKPTASEEHFLGVKAVIQQRICLGADAFANLRRLINDIYEKTKDEMKWQ